MASVYLAMQKSLDRPVAIKVLDATLTQDTKIQQQFEQESKLIAQLQHPNIVQVIDQGVTEQGLPYFVMPYIKSISLDSILQRDDISITRKMDILIQTCCALAYAHRNGIVHRDIKPANVLVDYDGHVRLVDFGIAGYFTANSQEAAQAQDEVAMGTSDYMAPEQRSGNSRTSHLSDIYSLGILIHEVIFGVLPTSAHEHTYANVQNDKYNFATALRPLIEKCIQPEPAKRPVSAEEVRQQLLLIAQGKHLRTNRWGIESTRDNIPTSYTLLDVLKENPFGATYLVNDPKHQRMLVIKKQHLDHLGNAHVNTTKLMHVQHPHIARIYGTGKNTRVFIAAMEYLPGGSLQERLTQAFSVGQWIHMAQQICNALACAHSYGIVHGNLRPSNLLFAANNHLKLTDFSFPSHTYGDESLWYHPLNEPISPCTDIYAAGSILFQLLSGKTPSTQWWGLKNYWRLRHVPAKLRELILRMIDSNPKKRFNSAATVAHAFEQLQSDQKTCILEKQIQF